MRERENQKFHSLALAAVIDVFGGGELSNRSEESLLSPLANERTLSLHKAS